MGKSGLFELTLLFTFHFSSDFILSVTVFSSFENSNYPNPLVSFLMKQVRLESH